MNERRRLMMQPHGKTGIMTFEDPEVKRICVENFGGESGITTEKNKEIGNWRTYGDVGVRGVAGEITYEQASAVHDFFKVFTGNESIKTFNEARFFGIRPTTGTDFREGMFQMCKSLESIDMRGWDMSGMRNFRYMFHKCDSLRKVRMDWDCKVRNAEYMFANNGRLTELIVPKIKLVGDGNIYSMFNIAYVGYLDISGLDMTGHHPYNIMNFLPKDFEKIKLSSGYFSWDGKSPIQMQNANSWTDVENIQSVIDVLPKCETQRNWRLSKNTQNAMTDEQKEIIKSKNWKITF